MLGYEKMLDETGREMHGSWGNMIEAEDAFARMGADVMRWQYCAQPPDQQPALRLRPGASEIKRKLLTFWNSRQVLRRRTRTSTGSAPTWAALEPDGELEPLDRWLVERTHAFVRRRRRRLRGVPDAST